MFIWIALWVVPMDEKVLESLAEQDVILKISHI